jgi:Tfp pilus assembly protein PilF
MLGNVLRRLFRQIRRDPSAAAAALSEVREALQKENYAAAKAAVDCALRADSREPEGYLLRAAIAQRQNQFKAAELDYRRALGLQPDSSAIRLELAAVLHRLGRFEESLSIIDDALAIAPKNVLATVKRGLLLKELGDFAEAERALIVASALDPANATVKSQLASVIADQGRLTEARELLMRVLERNESNIETHWTLATIELAIGEFSSGWDHYEYRRKRNDVYIRPRDVPWWRPGLACRGPLLVLAEQAIGDEIMFASCYAGLLRDVDDCHIECDRRLGGLFSRSFPGAHVLANRDPVSPEKPLAGGAIAQIAAGSLPRYYRRTRANFPHHDGYLRASPERVAYWRERLAVLGPGLNVGLSWVGGAVKTRRALRSLRLGDLEPALSLPGANFVSLQYTRCQEEIDAFARSTGIRVQHWPEAITDYDETASLVSALDMVISVTTAIVHLTGALGKPVWVLVPEVPEWRYMRTGTSMPWYPSAKLFRQSTLRQWAPVVEAIRSELSALIASASIDQSATS